MCAVLHRSTRSSHLTKQWTSSFASRFIIEKPLSTIHVSLKTRQTRRSTRSLPPFQDRIHDYIVALRIPDEWFQTPVMYERNLELRYFDSLCSKLEGALRSQKRLARRESKLLEIKSRSFLFLLSSFVVAHLIYRLPNNFIKKFSSKRSKIQ